MDHQAAIEVLRQVGIYKLAGTDGCMCMSCEIQGVSIDLSCRKSSGRLEHIHPGFYGTTLRVYSRHMDAGFEGLQKVADEVSAQIKDSAGDIAVRLCSWEQDNDSKCIYCGKPRKDAQSYFCEEHAKLGSLEACRDDFWEKPPASRL